MKRNTILTLSALATAAVIGAVAIPAIADDRGPVEGWGPRMMMGMMHGSEHGFMQGEGHGFMRGEGRGFMQGHDGQGMRMGRQAGHGPMGMEGMTENPVYQSFDTDKDGTVSTAELETGIAALQAEFDADGNGALSSDEFAALFAKVTRGYADRPFAMLDADENGEISAEEMAFPVQMMARMQAWHNVAPQGETDDN